MYQAWNKSRVRNSSVCKFRNSSGTMHYGSIRCFCFWGGEPVAVLAVFTPKHNALEEVQNSSIPELNPLSLSINTFIVKVMKLSITNVFVAVPVSSIISKCVHVPIKGKPYDFIVSLPNVYEHH